MNPRPPNRLALRAAAVAAAGFLSAAVLLYAQSGGGGSGVRPPRGPGGGLGASGSGRGGSNPGGGAHERCRIIKFDEFSDDDSGSWLTTDEPAGFYVGRLFAKPLARGKRSVRALLPRDLRVTLLGATLAPDDISDALIRGAYCDLGWRKPRFADQARRSDRELTSVTFQPLDVKGTIREVNDDSIDEPATIAIRAEPIGRAVWPHLSGQTGSSSSALSQAEYERCSRPLVIRLVVLHAYTVLVDDHGYEVSFSSLAPEDSIRATIVFGMPRGILVRLTLLAAEEHT